MDPMATLAAIGREASPLKRQLLMAALITRLLEERGRSVPVVIGGAALSYYSREVYLTADLDLAYADREALGGVLGELGFRQEGRYWVSPGLDMAVEAPAAALPGEEAPLERVEFGGGLYCRVLGVEDLIIDRLNACKHWKSRIDCEMAALLLERYGGELDWAYLRRRATAPENDCAELLADPRGGAP